MKFHEKLTEYCYITGATTKRISELTQIDKSTISRYRNGSRVPESGALVIKKLENALVIIAKENNIDNIPKNIYKGLNDILEKEAVTKEKQQDSFVKNLDKLLNELEISNINLARQMNVDASYISRVRNGQRKPTDINGFIHNLCDYIIKYCFKEKDKKKLAKTISKDVEILSESNIVTILYEWMLNEKTTVENSFSRFINKLDEFDLNEYIDAINFNGIKIPNVPVSLPISKKYYGIDNMRTGTIDFIKSVVTNKQSQTLTMYSDISMEQLGEDIEFGKKWMFGLAASIKKGIHLNSIHCLDRSFDELMLGLESWIPIYMTGQVSPFYFKTKTNSIFCHHLFVSETAVLSGECMPGYENEGMYYFTKKKEEIDYYRRKAEHMLESASPLMKIFTKDNETYYYKYKDKLDVKGKKKKNILSSPPIYTISDELLEKLFDYNEICQEDRNRILNKIDDIRHEVTESLKVKQQYDVIYRLDKEEFDKLPVVLHLSEVFEEINIRYSYELYKEHFGLLDGFATRHDNYSYSLSEDKGFRNIQISILEGVYVLVSKNNMPIINFIIEHSKLREAFERMIIPVVL